jgi:hypothetical protein
MANHLSGWIFELHERFSSDELEKRVAKAKITIGLFDPITKEVQYHSLDYLAK